MKRKYTEIGIGTRTGTGMEIELERKKYTESELQRILYENNIRLHEEYTKYIEKYYIRKHTPGDIGYA